MAAGGYELGAAYLSLVVSTRDMSKSVNKAVGEMGGTVDKAAKGAGNTWTAKVGKGITKSLKWGAIGVAGLGASVAALAAKGGISRALNIEDAQAKLKGLGHSQKTIDQIMKNSLASVKGTAFGLGDAATAAAGAVASGVKPGKDLERTLKLIGDGATIAGVSFAEMGAIFNKGAASNKIQGDILAQLGDKGIPIVQLLAKEMGVTAEEVTAMASKGKVDFATFQKAMEGGMGGAALSSGDTFRGALANTMAALGRVGETALKPLLDIIKTGFNDAIPMIDSFNDAIKPFIEGAAAKLPGIIKEITGGFKAFVAAFQYADGDITSSGFPGFMERLGYIASILWDVIANGIVPALMDFGGWIIKNRGWLAPLAVMVTGIVLAYKAWIWTTTTWKKVTEAATAAQKLFNTTLKANPAILIVSLIVGLIAAIVYLYNTNEDARRIIDGVWSAIKTIFSVTWKFIKDVFKGLVGWLTKDLPDGFGSLGRIIGEVFGNIKDFIGSAFEFIKGLFFKFHPLGIVIKNWGPIVDFVKGIFGKAIGFIGGLFSTIGKFIKDVFAITFLWLYNTIIKPIWDKIMWIVDFAANVMLLAFDLVVWVVKNVFAKAFVWLYENVIRPVFEKVKGAIEIAVNFVVNIFKTAVNFVRNVFAKAFTWLYESVIKPVWDAVSAFIKRSIDGIISVLTTVITFVKNVFATAWTWLRDTVIIPVFNAVKTAISTAWNFIKDIFNKVIGFIRGVLSTAFTWFRDSIVKPVFNGIKAIISGVWNKGIKPIFEALGKFVSETLPSLFEQGVALIGKFWDALKAIALAPINFIIETVFNKGIVGTFNKVAEAIGSEARLKELPSLGKPSRSVGPTSSASRMGGGSTKVNARAKGGFTPRGWTLVGEEGPELVNFAAPGMVYTAAQTRMMQAGQQQMPMDALTQKNNPVQAERGIGGFWESLGGKIKAGWDSSVSFIRGGLSKAAGLVLSPIKTGLRNLVKGDGLGGLARDLGINTIDNVVKWIAGSDTPAEGAGGAGAGGGSGGTYDGPLGKFHRPSYGPFTSMFGPRWGGFHAGVDIAGGGKTFAALNGIVKFIGKGGGLPGRTGHGIRLSHGGGFETYYGHNPYGGVQVKPGQQVKAGQHIGYQGATGNVTGTHLHFETLKNGRPLNPLTYLHDDGGWHAPGTMSFNNLKKPEAVLKPEQWADIHSLAVKKTTSDGTGLQVTVMNPVPEMASTSIQKVYSRNAYLGLDADDV